MRARKLLRSLCTIVLGLALVGCGNDAEDACEEACEYADRCSGVSVSCSESAISECADRLEGLSSGCQDATADLYSCINSVDSCTDDVAVAQECGGELGDYVEECAGEDIDF